MILLKIANLNATLQSHQEKALEKSRTVQGMILNHGLGSGKTVTSLAIAEDRGGNVLVVCPASLEENFRKEINRFVKQPRRSAYTIVSYAKFRKDWEKWVDMVNPTTLICDEIHRARNPGKTRNAIETAKKKRNLYVLGLTASIVNNHPMDGVRLVNLVAKDKVMTEEEFKQDHIGTEQVGVGLVGWLKGAKPGEVKFIKNKPKLKNTLGRHIDRFEGSEEYFKNLPKKTERIVEVELNKRQQVLMNFLERENPALAYKVRNNLPPSKKESTQLNAFLGGMRQVSNNPSTFDQGERISPKIQRMVSDIHEMQTLNPKGKAVIYSKFLESGSVPVVERAGGMLYSGKVSKKDRKKLVEDYNTGKLSVMGISPAGNEGIDLKGTRLLQIMEPDWNPETVEQAIGRGVRYKSHAHLPEDQREVVVNRYISVNPKKWYQMSRSGSVDEYLMNRATEKKKFNNEFLEAFNDGE